MKQTVLLLRHGATPGNALHKYIGSTDEPLSPEGRTALEALRYPAADLVYISPKLRCRQTAELLFPGAHYAVVEDLREMHFGVFENRSFRDMEQDEDYSAWLARNCETPCPGGEAKADFTDRCCAAFRAVLAADSSPRLTFVIHGGSIMAILSRYGRPARDYYDWAVDNGKGYLLEWDPDAQILQLLEAY